MELRLNLKQNAFHTLHRTIMDFRSATRPERVEGFDHNDHSLTLTHSDGRTYFSLDEMYTRPPHYYDFKFFILNSIQVLELLLKEILRAHDPDSIFTDGTRTKTITLTEAINKTTHMQPELFDKQQLSALMQAKTLRNKLEHFEISWTAPQFERVARYLFAIINYVCYSALKIRLSEFYSFDPWKGQDSDIVDTIRELVQNNEVDSPLQRTVSDWQQRNPEDQMLFCAGCGHLSASTTLKKCVLCGEELDASILPFLL